MPKPDLSKAKVSFGAKYGYAMSLTDPKEAAAYFAEMVEHQMLINPGINQETACSIEQQNLGYWTGYYDPDHAQRIQRLFNVTHPIFGSV